MEDISSEKRVKSTMSRYMDPSVADKLIQSGEELLGGISSEATALFSDVRGFTTITEELGAQGTVTLLNEYFTLMVDCIQKEDGMLDKFIGDAIMSFRGGHLAGGEPKDHAIRVVRASINGIRALYPGSAPQPDPTATATPTPTPTPEGGWCADHVGHPQYDRKCT